ncbi:sulfite exporter TauE/SafE family protein [Tsuneonella sp. HG094]
MILGLTVAAIATGLAAALVAGFVRGLAGFGLAILLVPVLGLAIPPAEAVVAGNWLGFMISMVSLRKQVAETERSAWVIAGVALLAIPLGVLALSAVTPEVARLLIALVAIGAFVAVLLPPRPHERPARGETVATGVASGLLTGFAGMPGPPVVPFYLRRPIAPATARASMMSVFLVTQGAGALSALALGVATWREFLVALGLYPAVFVGNWVGGKAFGRIDPRAWRWIAGAVLGLAAGGAALKLVSA